MKNRCPACRVIYGERPGSGKLCPECRETEGVEIAYMEFLFCSSVKQTVVLMTLVWPVLLIAHLVFLAVVGRFNAWGIVMQVVCWATWVFNVFYLYPKLGVPRFGAWKKMEDARDKLFVTKVAGRRVVQQQRELG